VYIQRIHFESLHTLLSSSKCIQIIYCALIVINNILKIYDKLNV